MKIYFENNLFWITKNYHDNLAELIISIISDIVLLIPEILYSIKIT